MKKAHIGPPVGEQRGQAGIALPMAIVLMLFLVIVGMSLLSVVSTRIRISSRSTDSYQAQLLAEAGAELGAQYVKKTPLASLTSTLGTNLLPSGYTVTGKNRSGQDVDLGRITAVAVSLDGVKGADGATPLKVVATATTMGGQSTRTVTLRLKAGLSGAGGSGSTQTAGYVLVLLGAALTDDDIPKNNATFTGSVYSKGAVNIKNNLDMTGGLYCASAVTIDKGSVTGGVHSVGARTIPAGMVGVSWTDTAWASGITSPQESFYTSQSPPYVVVNSAADVSKIVKVSGAWTGKVFYGGSDPLNVPSGSVCEIVVKGNATVNLGTIFSGTLLAPNSSVYFTDKNHAEVHGCVVASNISNLKNNATFSNALPSGIGPIVYQDPTQPATSGGVGVVSWSNGGV